MNNAMFTSEYANCMNDTFSVPFVAIKYMYFILKPDDSY